MTDDQRKEAESRLFAWGTAIIPLPMSNQDLNFFSYDVTFRRAMLDSFTSQLMVPRSVFLGEVHE